MQTGRLRAPVAVLALCAAAAALTSVAVRDADAGQATAPLPYVYDAAALQDGAWLQSWLLCGPFPNPGALDNAGACLHDQACSGFFTDYLAPIGGEIGCAPQEDLQVPGPDQKTRRWTAVSTLGGRVYLDDYISPSEFQTGYAVCWIDAPEATDRLFGVGGDDGIRIWVNGEEIFRFHAARSLAADEHYVRMPLRAGRNQVLVKVDNGNGRWGFMMRPVDNTVAVKEVINRLRKVLRFDFHLSESGYDLTLGDPIAIGNIDDLPQAEIHVMNSGGETVRVLEAPLCRPVYLPFAEFPDPEYTLEGKVLWPYRGRVLIPGMLYRGDIRSEVQAMIAAEPPAMPPGQAAEAYHNLIETVVEMDQFNRFSNEPFAYRRLKHGLTQALENAIGFQNARSPYALLFPRPRQAGTSSNAMVNITGNWTFHAADSIFDDTIDADVLQRWNERTSALSPAAPGKVYVFALQTDFLDTPTAELSSDDSEFREPASVMEEFVPADREGYAIRLQPDGVIIAGRSAAGAFYGLDTFLQLLEHARQTEKDTLALDSGTIIDAPVYRTRASLLTLRSWNTDFETVIDRLAALRCNTVFLPSPLYTQLEDREVQETLTAAYAYCRARFVEPIPLVETFGAQTVAATVDPNLLEGVYVEELPAVIDDLRRVHLPYDRILDSESTHPRLRTAKGYKILREGRDYVFESYAPPVIQLKGQAPVQTGETLLITADLVDLSQAATPASCPSDTRTWLFTEKLMADLYTHLKPRGVHLGQTGAGYLNRDSRCRERGMPNDLILADTVQKGCDIVRKLDRKADIFIWGDHFNPLQRSLELDAVKAPQQLPRDITILDGHYRSDAYFDVWRVNEGINYFDQFGFDTMGVVRGDPLNTAQFAAMKREHPQRFRGILHYPVPGEENGQFLAAQAGWEGVTLLGTLPATSPLR